MTQEETCHRYADAAWFSGRLNRRPWPPAGLGALAFAMLVLMATAALGHQNASDKPGGEATSFAPITERAFSHPSANMPADDAERFLAGKAVFNRVWLPASTNNPGADGLGPLYNARGCQRCHLRDGRGHPPEGPDDLAVSMVVHLSVPPDTPQHSTDLETGRTLAISEPTYGTQLQDFALPSLPAEGQLRVVYNEFAVELTGGEVVFLRQPEVAITDLGYGPMAPSVMLSARVANPMIGLGLLGALANDDILALADPDDRNGDRVSGRPSWVFDPMTGERALGRFGWKASTPSVLVHSADAFATDTGLSTTLFPSPFGDCTPEQPDCLAAAAQGDTATLDVSDSTIDLVAFYARNLAVPARRDADDPAVRLGETLFHEIGCAACHTPSFVTRPDALDPFLSSQVIWPYTDLLLHDMGEGLADNRPTANASGREWRTAPLWGIGLTETVSGQTNFLHDGRARSLLEATLWHGGEAERARDAVIAMQPADRAALIRFVESL